MSPLAIAGSAILLGAASQTGSTGFTSAQVARGMALYERHCATCHGPAMQGGDGSPALVGPRFAATWSGKPAPLLGERIRITMPQDDPGILRSDEAEALAAALRARNIMAASQSPLQGERSGDVP